MAEKQAKTAKKKTLVLLDAHAILHRAYHALPDFTSPNGEPTGALYGVTAMILRIVEDLKPDYIAACYDLPEPTYRHEAYEDYKAGRSKTDDSLVEQINRSRDLMAAFGIPIYEHPGFEADDMLGTIAHQMKPEKDIDVVIASGDMDTFQLIDKKKVRVYTQRKGSEVVMYDEAAIKERFGFGPKLTIDYKGIRGDTSDNIPGVKGVGETSALKLVGTYGPIEKIYTAIKKKGVEEVAKESGVQKRFIQLVADNREEAEFSKMLATIRLDAPITFALPEQTWQEKLDLEQLLTLFAELGFRTLGNRVQLLFGDSDSHDEITETGENVPEQDIKEAAMALWLLESDTTNPTFEDILSYGRAEGIGGGFAEIKKHLLQELKKEDLEKIYTEIELPLIPVLEEMKATGIKLDVAYLKKLSKKLHKELSGIEKRIYKHAGGEFNINSPKQLGEVLFDTLELKPKNAKKTAGGQRSTKESELEKLKDDHEIIPEVLRYRELQKLLSTYIDNLPDMVGKDGRLHPTFLQSGAVTGRMATKDPSIQNIPVRTEEGRLVRGAFVAEPGFKLVAIDYSQVELRIAAFLSEDPKLIDIFKRGEDVHRGVALRVFGVNAEEVTDNMRRKAKVINFGILYGMGVNALRTNLGDDTPRAEAQEFLNAYFNTFTHLAEYLEETKGFARQHGYTTTFFGRKRHFPGITSSAPFIRAQAERMAINAPIQGTSADFTRIAMVKIAAYLKEMKLEKDVRMLLQVHDELVFEINEKKLEVVVPELEKLMTSMVSEKDTHGVPILVDAKVGENWLEMEEWQ
ncbi:MAG: DNA polymerase [Patescibacteria group bacterium]